MLTGSILILGLGGSGIKAAPLSIPPSVPVDEEKFLSNFEFWTVLSNFRIEEYAEDGTGYQTKEFVVDVELIEGRSTRNDTVRLVVEIFRNGECVQVVKSNERYHVQNLKPDRNGSAENGSGVPTVQLRMNYPIHQMIEDGGQPRCFAYLSSSSFNRSGVPVSSIIELGDGPGERSPVIYPRVTAGNGDELQLSGLEFDLKPFDSSDQDAFSFEFSTTSGELPLLDEGEIYLLKIEDDFANVSTYYLFDMSKKASGETTVDSRWSANEDETHFMKRRPLKIYVVRGRTESDHLDRHRSIIVRRELVSNILIAE